MDGDVESEKIRALEARIALSEKGRAIRATLEATRSELLSRSPLSVL